ncbi:hypothetical protein DFH08DRAFT_304189 [Mycena albidolilacea]|uniref:Uncharacterized protein n=1 Tax=Mycena albidolilacea TaxID=1033008 RepID=A0AAD7ELC0_9AGAR|nr:hypothetical protein DFH08DRAFT_304189 [Mycena albidolilacea]
MYQGNGAEEEWWQQLAKYTSLRHPNIVQIYGAASSGGIHATLFHDHLVPFQQYVDTYRYSHFTTVYFYACCTVDFHAASDHVYSTFQRDLYPNEYTVWIRPSSGQLCAELIPSSTLQPYLYHNPAGISYSHRISSASDMKLMVVESLTTKWYHNICSIYLSQFRTISISTSKTVNLGAIISWSPGHPLKDPVEIADTPNVHTSVDVWESCEGAERVVIEDGWTRFKSHDVFNRTIKLGIWAPTSRGPWLSQANNIFRSLRIMSNFEDYVLVCDVYFGIKVPGTTEELPAGFLFLSPRKDFKTGPSSYRWPNSPAYWSLTPSGVDRLTLEEATQLGFPTFQCTTEIVGRSWDASVYKGLRKFHQAKGFDPDTQELARHLEHPLFELSAEVDSTFAHGDFKATEQPRAAEDEHKSDDPQTEASVSEDVDTNTEGSHPEQDNHDSDSVRTNCGADHSAENMNSEDQVSSAPNASGVAEKKPDPPTLHAETIAL